MGSHVIIYKYYCISAHEDCLAIREDPGVILRQFIWVFTVCQSTYLHVSSIQRINYSNPFQTMVFAIRVRGINQYCFQRKQVSPHLKCLNLTKIFTILFSKIFLISTCYNLTSLSFMVPGVWFICHFTCLIAFPMLTDRGLHRFKKLKY